MLRDQASLNLLADPGAGFLEDPPELGQVPCDDDRGGLLPGRFRGRPRAPTPPPAARDLLVLGEAAGVLLLDGRVVIVLLGAGARVGVVAALAAADGDDRVLDELVVSTGGEPAERLVGDGEGTMRGVARRGRRPRQPRRGGIGGEADLVLVADGRRLGTARDRLLNPPCGGRGRAGGLEAAAAIVRRSAGILAGLRRRLALALGFEGNLHRAALPGQRGELRLPLLNLGDPGRGLDPQRGVVRLGRPARGRGPRGLDFRARLDRRRRPADVTAWLANERGGQIMVAQVDRLVELRLSRPFVNPVRRGNAGALETPVHRVRPRFPPVLQQLAPVPAPVLLRAEPVAGHRAHRQQDVGVRVVTRLVVIGDIGHHARAGERLGGELPNHPPALCRTDLDRQRHADLARYLGVAPTFRCLGPVPQLGAILCPRPRVGRRQDLGAVDAGAPAVVVHRAGPFVGQALAGPVGRGGGCRVSFAARHDAGVQALELKRKQLDARIADLRAANQADTRKRDTRRKILVGAVVLNQADTNEAAKTRLWKLLDQALDKDRDRELFNLEPRGKT